MTRLRPEPALNYVHPRATGVQHESALHVDVVEESAPNHLRWIADLCRPYLGSRVLDVGAGEGALTAHLAADRELVAVDMSDACVRALATRFAESPNVTVLQGNVGELCDERGFDAIVMVNLLEHIAEDADALTDLRALMRPEGRLVIYVPAMNWLYSNFDRRVGHYRRYAKWRLRAVVEQAGFRVLELRYLNALAIPGWVALSHTGLGERPASGLALWDRVGVPLSRSVESRVRLPIGLNLLCVAS